MSQLQRTIVIPKGSNTSVQEYQNFLDTSYSLLKRHCLYFADGHEDINDLELSHLIPPVAESVLAIYTAFD